MRSRADIESEIKEKTQYWANAVEHAKATKGTEWEEMHLESARRFNKTVMELVEEAAQARY